MFDLILLNDSFFLITQVAATGYPEIFRGFPLFRQENGDTLNGQVTEASIHILSHSFSSIIQLLNATCAY